jgi:hypothetical protein
LASSVVYSLTLVNGDETTTRVFRDEGSRDAARVIMALERWTRTRVGDRGKWTLEAVLGDPEGFVGDTSDYEVYFTVDTVTLEGAA